jgi:oligoendopeptidase F
MGFFATKFSRILPGLLILAAISPGECMNILKTNNLKEEPMPVARDEIPVENRWNVEALYQTPESWKAEFLQIQGQEKAPKWPRLSQFRGKLSDPKAVLGLFETYLDLMRKLEKLHVYAHMRMDEDLGNDLFKSNYGQISTIFHEFSLETSWVEPEFLGLNNEQFQKLLSDPALAPYKFHLEKIGRMRPHTLSPEMEELMALSGRALDASQKAYSALNNADLTFKNAVDSKGKEHPLSNGSYANLLRSQDRVLRKSAFQNVLGGFEAHANTLCELIQGQVQAHQFVARARKFKNCLEAALFPHQIDPSVYENLIASVRARLPLMHEYVALRKKLLKLPDIHAYDMNVPLVERPMSIWDMRKRRKPLSHQLLRWEKNTRVC